MFAKLEAIKKNIEGFVQKLLGKNKQNSLCLFLNKDKDGKGTLN